MADQVQRRGQSRCPASGNAEQGRGPGGQGRGQDYPKTIQGAVQRVEQETARAAAAAALADIPARPPDETAALHAATVAGLHSLVTAGSVDAVITQPPHTEEALPLLADLADFAAHVLKGTGVMAVAGNGVILPRMLERLAHPDLRWLVEFDLVFHGKPASSGQPHFMHLHRRPVLVYGKGEFRPDGMRDLLEVLPREELPGGMTEHEAAMTMVLERFCRPGQTVCDPVMLDRAGTALAARRLGCTFVGGSEMQSSIDRIRVRLARAENQGRNLLSGDSGAERSPRSDGAPAVRMCQTSSPESGSLARTRRSHDPEGPGGAGKPTDPFPGHLAPTRSLDNASPNGPIQACCCQVQANPGPRRVGPVQGDGASRFRLVRNMEIPRRLVATSRPSVR